MSDVKQCPDQGPCYCPNCEMLEKDLQFEKEQNSGLERVIKLCEEEKAELQKRVEELKAQVEKEKKVFHYGYLPGDLKKMDDMEKELSELRKENERFKEALIQIRDTMEKDGGFPKTVPEINKVLNGEESERYESLRELLRDLENELLKMSNCSEDFFEEEFQGVVQLLKIKSGELHTRIKEALK